MRLSFLGIVIASGIMAGFRLGGEKGIPFQAIVHLWMGGLIGAQVVLWFHRDLKAQRTWFWFLVIVALIMSAIEVFAFFAGRG